ncbi:MAG: PAS domain-containing protein [Gemmataceae bacterium]|nr:PAS domain-containing protein [Gemmataceae bacterium]
MPTLLSLLVASLAVAAALLLAVRARRSDRLRREAEERYRFLADALPHMVWTLRPDLSNEFLNARALEFSGWTMERLRREGWAALIHPDDLPAMREALAGPQARGEAHEAESRLLRHDGQWRRVLSRAVPVKDAQGRVVRWVGTTTDIHDAWLDKERLRQLAAERETLLREVHHRVKNNLQVVSSLLRLPGAHPEAEAVLRECRDRVRSIALIHERLYHSPSCAGIELSGYLRGLAAHLFRAYRTDEGRVSFVLEGEEMRLGLELAVPCGLILNELLSNSLRHGFGEGKAGTLRVRLSHGPAEWSLEVADDGAGFPAAVDPAAPRSFGLRLVADLVEQLHGSLRFGGGPGASVLVRFPSPGEPR